MAVAVKSHPVGHRLAMTNFRFMANQLLTTEETVSAMAF